MSNKPNNEEEIDLGSLFVIIGRGFSKLFQFIGSIFKQLFHFLITILLFLKTNAIKLGIAAIIGAVIGTFLEFSGEKKFGSDLHVQTNFESARQLYNNVLFYNDLVKQEKHDLLAEIFKISDEEAQSLKKFTIDPVKNNNDIITSYDELILSVDTLTVKSFSFYDFKNAFTKYNYKVHVIQVQSTKNDVFSRLDDIIISAITENQYFNKLKELNNENLNRTDLILRKNLAQTDSLHKVYKDVLLEEAKKTNSGTNIDLGNGQQSNRELELFRATRELNKELKKVSDDKAEKSEIINVVSNFQPIGYEIKGISKNKAVQLSLALVAFTILILLLIQVNSFLNNYKK
ncbi:hypothetical protein WH52_13265 [Tenacibaculum holothuriorum]|uniref:Uncharacterized protein n=1 Tax=Tenacibaculum holothuriorum TaxID=1635173 RepID=A0A1Y2PB91_9FLAO|nr:hypothetical protein [Tenacibaculum holothuriorum]OSY87029.1 hypothetical protein WH52_13265 [Tenacibaculum holothuriorum]